VCNALMRTELTDQLKMKNWFSRAECIYSKTTGSCMSIEGRLCNGLHGGRCSERRNLFHDNDWASDQQ